MKGFSSGMSTENKIAALRQAMKEAGVDGYLVPKADEYQGEFVAPYAERLTWLTGFTGSAGLSCVLAEKAIVITDARYTIQVVQQVDGNIFETADGAALKLKDWIVEYAVEGAVIGYDPRLFTKDQIERYEGEGFLLKALPENLVDTVWADQPELPRGAITVFPGEIAGKSVQQKLEIVQEELQKQRLDAFVLSLPDSIAWLLNVRGSDVDYIPLVLSYAVVHADGPHVDWFIDSERVQHIDFGAADVRICAQDSLERTLGDLSGNVGVDAAHTPVWFLDQLGERSSAGSDPCIAPKAVKTEQEQKALKKAHLQDGVALVKFLKWLEDETLKYQLTEWDAAQKLKQFRSEYEGFKGNSFPTICGFGENGAIVHYRATKERNKLIDGAGLLLIDSGGQYAHEADGVFGTTDITRTVAVGVPTEEMKRAFTLVLKGHIAVASAKFPEGTTGAQVDTLARHPLWQEGLDFAHGTGHGVGCYLAVHEAAASLSPRGTKPVQAGMLLSNEPGYYKEGAFGVRIENLVLAQNSGDVCDNGKKLLHFETVSFAPIDVTCIDKELLAREEIDWLNAYHKSVFDALSPFLDNEHSFWLKNATQVL